MMRSLSSPSIYTLYEYYRNTSRNTIINNTASLPLSITKKKARLTKKINVLFLISWWFAFFGRDGVGLWYDSFFFVVVPPPPTTTPIPLLILMHPHLRAAFVLVGYEFCCSLMEVFTLIFLGLPRLWARTEPPENVKLIKIWGPHPTPHSLLSPSS